MNISFEGINQELVTFLSGNDVLKGQTVKMSGSMTVSACDDNSEFIGIAAANADTGAVAVIIRGYVTVTYTGSAPTLGYTAVSANGSGGIKAASTGRKVLICDVDSTNSTVGMFI